MKPCAVTRGAGSKGIQRVIDTKELTQADSVSLQAAENVELADRLVCEVLRGEQPLWPEKGDAGFEQTFQQRSFHHGVQALIYDGLHATDVWSSYPPQTRGLLTDSLRAGAAYDLLRAHRVSGFLEELSRRHIPFLVIKGDALARTHYSNTSLRVRSDTDLFIHMGDISAVQKTLLDLGFEVIPPIYKTHQFTGVWGRESNAAVIFDIHWRMLNAARFARIIGFTEALEHSISIPGMNHCRTLGAVDSLLLACMHRKGSDRHDEDRLIWLYDIHLLVSNMTAQQLEDLTKKCIGEGRTVLLFERFA